MRRVFVVFLRFQLFNHLVSRKILSRIMYIVRLRLTLHTETVSLMRSVLDSLNEA